MNSVKNSKKSTRPDCQTINVVISPNGLKVPPAFEATTIFTHENDMKELILRKDIYDMLEKVIDRYRDAAGVALQIVLKHS